MVDHSARGTALFVADEIKAGPGDLMMRALPHDRLREELQR